MPSESQAVPPSDVGTSTTPNQPGNYRLLTILIIAGIFATTLPQPQVLGKLPLQNLLKNDLHIAREDMAKFFFLCGLAWYLKPFAGILTDAFPLFGTRRRYYLLGSSILAGVSWVGLALAPRTYNGLLVASIVVNLFMVIMSTVVGAVLVETGQSAGATGRLTAVRQAVSNVCTLINGPLSGLLATAGLSIAAGVNAGLVVSIFPVAYILLREAKRVRLSTERHPLYNAQQQLRTIGRSRTLWFAILFIGLFYFSPGFNTPLYYRQNDELHFSQQAIGNLGIYSGGLGIVASLLYGQAIRFFSLKTMIVFGIVTAASGTLLYLLYTDYTRAIFIEAQNGFFFTFAEVALIDMAARATPAGCEGLGYSLILSMRNVALFGADWLGSKFADEYKLPFSTLVFVNAGTTLIVLVLLPFIPSILMRSKDAGAVR